MFDLHRIFRLISKTRDKFVVHDDQFGDFAVLTLEDYERLIEGGERQRMRPKRDEQIPDEFIDDLDEFDETLAEKKKDDVLDEHYYFEPLDEEK